MSGAQLTAARVREVLAYNPDTGAFVWRVTLSNRAPAGSQAGRVSRGYVIIGLDGRNYAAARLAWLYVHGEWPAKSIDHIDCNPSSNRITNLREATQAQNMANRSLARNSTTGFKGVTRLTYEGPNKYRAGIQMGGKRIHLGCFATAEEASAAYIAAAREHSGEFARAR